MTTVHPHQTSNRTWPLLAVIGAGLSVVLTAIGTFLDLTGNEPGAANTSEELWTYAAVNLPIILVATLIVFAIETRSPTPTAGLVFGLLSVATVVVAWSGLPAVFAAASVAAALGSSRMTGPAKAGVALSVLGLAGAVAFAIAG